MPGKKEIIYPFFLECCQFAEDTFWESIFEDLAYGDTPYGTYINKGFLCCSYKGKEFSYKLERKDSHIMYDDIYGLLTKKVGILSQKEKQKKRLDFHKVEKTIKISREKWSDIRKKNIKDLLLERYVIDMRKKYSLTFKQAKYLLAVVTIAIVFKIITSKDITYENNKIKNIEGVEISKGKINLTRNIYNVDTNKQPEIHQKKKFSDNWEKYLKMLRKK